MKDKGEPLPDLLSVYFWRANINLNLLIISFKGMSMENTTTTKKSWFYYYFNTKKIKDGFFSFAGHQATDFYIVMLVSNSVKNPFKKHTNKLTILNSL